MGRINALARVAHAHEEDKEEKGGGEGEVIASMISHPSARLLLRRYQNARKTGRGSKAGKEGTARIRC